MLDTHQLNVFIKASETLNFTQAAKQLHMSQPSVSQHIQSLESHFKTQLFLRSGSKLQLTEAGQALVPMARDMVKKSIHIDETMSSLQGEVFGTLQVGCTTTPGKYILPKLLAQFHHQHPKVSVTCHVTPQARAMELLTSGKIHFALAGIVRKSYPGIEAHQFMSDHIELIVPRAHRWAHEKQLTAEQLQDCKFILREQESGTYQVVRQALASINIEIEQLDTLMTLGNSEAIALAVKEGLGVGFVSQSVVESMGQDGLKAIKLANLDITRDIYFSRNKNQMNSKAQNAFWEFITKIPGD